MRLLAHGRDADVFDAGKDRVLRRYRDPSSDVSREARAMRFARDHGVPVPEVFDAEGPDLVLERIEGTTMGGAIVRRPWTMASHARLLADLHNLVHGVPGPSWLDRPFRSGDRLIHLDLHPDNVLMSRSGPVIIDWSYAAVGPAEADVADAFLIISGGSAPGGVLVRTFAAIGQRHLADVFLRAADANISSVVTAAATRRQADRNLSPAERKQISQIAQRHQSR